MFHVPENNRITKHPYLGTTKEEFGNNGAFWISQSDGRELWIIASDGGGWEELKFPGIPWEHVSIHVLCNGKMYTPRWDEMCKVKDKFWDEDDVVIQFHPKKSEYINMHPNTLHLWRPVGIELPTPPKETVGYELARRDGKTT